MSKLTVTVFMFLMSGNFVFSQNIDFLNYNRIVNQAELAIVDSSYADAISYYEKAFLSLKIPKGKDLHNAAICSVLQGKFDNTFNYFDLLVEKGVEKEYFENVTFKPLEKDNRYKKFLDSFEGNHQRALSRKNLKLLDEINQMNTNDQAIARLKDFDPSKYPEFIDTVVSNINRLEKIIAQYGFPDEDMVGIQAPYYPVPIGFLLLHYYQIESFYYAMQDSVKYNDPKFASRKHVRDIDFPKFNITRLHKEAIRQGKFSPYLYANHQDQFGNAYGSITTIQVDSHVGNIRYSGNRELEINSDRIEIGLELLKDYYKKVEFIQKYTGLTTINENETPEEYRERINVAFSDTKEKFDFDLAGYSMTFFYTTKEDGDKFFEKIMEKCK